MVVLEVVFLVLLEPVGFKADEVDPALVELALADDTTHRETQ